VGGGNFWFFTFHGQGIALSGMKKPVEQEEEEESGGGGGGGKWSALEIVAP